MNGIAESLNDVTLLITHYNRSSSLEQLLKTFRDLPCTFGEIVVSDDGSRQEHLSRLKSLQRDYNFRLITTPQNKGLGNNINKGQDEVKTPYTLYVQEDFVPAQIFPEHLADALNFMKTDQSLDIVRFFSYFPYPTLKPYGKGFLEMVFRNWDMNHLKFYCYSDNPHLRRSNFLEKFGRYPEGVKADLTEYKMAISFLQHSGHGLFYEKCTKLFLHNNSEDEPSTVDRKLWRQKRKPLILFLRALYLRYKWTKGMFDLKYMRSPTEINQGS